MAKSVWFKIAETQELSLCSDADLARNSAPRLPTDTIELDRTVEVTPRVTVRMKPPLRTGGGTSVTSAPVPMKLLLLAALLGCIALVALFA